MLDPDLEIRGGEGGPVIRGGGAWPPWAPPLDPPLANTQMQILHTDLNTFLKELVGRI